MTPKNNRAPGMTCLRACERLEISRNWFLSTEKNSKGCGANMRVVPVGMLIRKGIGFSEIAKIAQLQSAITHGHPTALAASDITAITIAFLLKGVEPKDLLEELMSYSIKQRITYYSDYLKNLWDRPPFHNSEDFISTGWDEVLNILQKVKIGLLEYDKDIDPCQVVGEGWVAEESFGTALFCFLLTPDKPISTLKKGCCYQWRLGFNCLLSRCV